MTIHELTVPACLGQLQRAHLGRLARARDAQPYVVPISFCSDRHDECLSSFSTVGQKSHRMRDNPRVRVVLDEVVERPATLPSPTVHRTAVLYRVQVVTMTAPRAARPSRAPQP